MKLQKFFGRDKLKPAKVTPLGRDVDAATAVIDDESTLALPRMSRLISSTGRYNRAPRRLRDTPAAAPARYPPHDQTIQRRPLGRPSVGPRRRRRPCSESTRTTAAVHPSYTLPLFITWLSPPLGKLATDPDNRPRFPPLLLSIQHRLEQHCRPTRSQDR